ncbi:Sodium- and chloride-dependent GABA transporter 2 [Fusarium oxysporum f. sp. cubense race 1]|uniref:Sodium-and chloride-dependent GABA transporter 2 n=1 Tax=Fusarium oxysporum f. sp. cubense (strain race 1) TaxID=1229664 RepID=N4TMI1_FUSC1|nr:Sodium- and chloride-dependent GABA transporter 2 [Fusarium oxysporum f. sp. cubense race 1]
MAVAEKGQKPGMAKRIFLMLAPDSAKDDDGRDNFNSRSQFVLCAMGGAVGLGNLLRFPSVVFNNYGLQFFIPYAVALFLIGIPILILEITLGQAYRGGCVIAWNNVNHRAKGIGLRCRFRARCRGMARIRFTGGADDGGGLKHYPGRGIVGETFGWCVMIWFVVWMCTFKGVGLTGRVIYITMALPLIMIGILAIRSLSLPNASDGFRLYVGTWRSESLEGPRVWQDAFGQMFFSIGVGFGYFTSYASYNNKFANAVQDAFIIALSNSAIEIISALAVMGVVGFLAINPGEVDPLSTFSSGFFYYPQALAQMPGSNFFSALFFITLVLLGLTCVFALAEVLVTLICDTNIGQRIPRWIISTSVIILGCLTSLIYSSEFGFSVLDAVDAFVNDVALFITVWSETYMACTLYRWKDPVDQIGFISYFVYNGGYVLSLFLGLLIGHVVSAPAGAGVGFGIFIACALISAFVGKTPSIPAPRFWGNNPILSRFWYAAFYSGNQIRRDLNNAILGGQTNWKIHWVWPICLKYITGPAVALVFSFAYPKFLNNYSDDPPFIYSFVLMHMVVIFIIGAFLAPRFLNILIPSHRLERGDGKYDVAPQMTVDNRPIVDNGGLEGGHGDIDAAHHSASADGNSMEADKGVFQPKDETARFETPVEPRQ